MSKKHILLFEAFTSKTISKTINFLDKQVGKEERNIFLQSLNAIKDSYDLPISNIDDIYFEYLGKKDAMLVKNDSLVSNPDGIFCLKFWFSIDKGYQGYTYTGNTIKEKNKSSDGISFNDLRSLGIDSGTVYKINDLSNIKTGDKLVGIFSASRRDDYQIATAYRSDRGDVFAIQKFADGTKPSSDDDDKWKKYGPLSWKIGNNNRKNDDNINLCHYIDDGSTLNIDGLKLSDKADPMEFNLPLKDKSPRSWDERYNSITPDGLSISDFAIILYYDKLVSSEMKRPSDIIKSREEMKRGSYAFMENDAIRKANIDRYFDKICTGFGLDYKHDLNPKNLQRILNRLLGGKMSIYYIGWKDSTQNLYNLIESIGNLITAYNDLDIKTRDFSKLEDDEKNLIERRYKSSLLTIKKIYENRSSIKYITKCNDIIDKLKVEKKYEEAKLVERIISIGSYISDKISSMSIDNLNDLRLIDLKISSIRSLLTNKDLKFGRCIISFIENLEYTDNDSYYSVSSIKESDMIEENKRIDVIERYIKSIL